MQITLSKPELAKFIEDQVKQGRYASAEEVVNGALSLLQAHEELSATELADLKAAINAGIEQADRREVDAWDAKEIADEVERRYADEQKDH